MPITAAAPPQAVPGGGFFDYVTVDAVHRRVYAAHGGAHALLVVDASTGKVLGQVVVGGVAGSAPDQATGNVYTGDGRSNAVSEVDPVAMKELRRVSVAGPVDAIAYDPQLHRIYADEDDGTRIFVIDTGTFKQIATVALPGHKPEYLAIDPSTHDVYQNITDLNEIAVIDPKTLKVTRTISTAPAVTGNHPLQYDAWYAEIVSGGSNGALAAFTRDGHQVWQLKVPRMDQCSLDEKTQLIACAGSGAITLIKNAGMSAGVVASYAAPRGAHTVAIDPATGAIWFVYPGFVQQLQYREAPGS